MAAAAPAPGSRRNLALLKAMSGIVDDDESETTEAPTGLAATGLDVAIDKEKLQVWDRRTRTCAGFLEFQVKKKFQKRFFQIAVAPPSGRYYSGETRPVRARSCGLR